MCVVYRDGLNVHDDSDDDDVERDGVTVKRPPRYTQLPGDDFNQLLMPGGMRRTRRRRRG